VRYLWIGDGHAVASELSDCRKLADYILLQARVAGAPTVVFAGDQYDGHGTINLEVMAFWSDFFGKLKEQGFEVIAQVGNHDLPGNGQRHIHAMLAHKDQCTVVDKPYSDGHSLFMPYCHDPGEFVKACNEHPELKLVFAHQTFQGAKYDNSFYAPDGIDPEHISQETIVSGHIHTAQSFGKVHYLGAPRSRTLNDANQERNIWLLETKGGQLVSKTPISLSGICKQIIFFVDTPEDNRGEECDFHPQNDYRIDIVGPVDFVETRKQYYKQFQNVRIRTIPEKKAEIIVRESEGIEQAFVKFAQSFIPKYSTPKEHLYKMIKDRLQINV